MTTRILSCPVPDNINPLSPNGFMFSIEKLPQLTYFAQQVSLPMVTLSGAEMATPFVKIPIAGDVPDFTSLGVQFLIDERMENYVAIHNWITGLGFPESNTQYSDFINSSTIPGSELKRSYSDGTLTILGNSNNPIQTIQFFDLYPESLGTITFLSTSQDVQYLVGDVTFRYSYYKFI